MEQKIPAQDANEYHLVDLPPARRIVVSFLDMATWGHAIFALLEVDVTAARQRMREYEAQTGEHLSFTGYLIYCLARAVDENKSVQAYLKGRKQLVMFDDVDVGMMVEHRLGSSSAPIGYVVRRANHKSLVEIHREIRERQAQPPDRKEMPPWMRLVLPLPASLQKLLVMLVRGGLNRQPDRRVGLLGTVGVTAVGMFGEGGGWGFSAPDGHTLTMVVGGIARKPAIVDDRVEPREMLSLTLVFNHDVVDGAPAARFTTRLKELIEGGCGLDFAAPASSPASIHA